MTNGRAAFFFVFRYSDVEKVDFALLTREELRDGAMDVILPSTLLRLFPGWLALCSSVPWVCRALALGSQHRPGGAKCARTRG